MPELDVPEDLKAALAANPAAEAAWQTLTHISHRDFIGWISGAKKQETREKRVRICIEKLVAGKRRPCCYAVVPLDLYKILGEDPQAKAHWSTLSADHKRDFSEWIEDSEDKPTRKARVEHARALLLQGKLSP